MNRFLYVLLFFITVAGCGKNGSNPNPPPPAQIDIPAIDNAVATFMTTYSVPGVSIAITRNDKLVYVKSYGKMSASDNTPITNNSLFRIASVSKPVTAVAIMKLLEANQLTLDSKVFGTGSILGNDYPSTQLAAVADVTVRHLLQHTTNAWPNDGADQMFMQHAYTHSQLIKWTLDNYNAATPRGTHKYSNFGYCVLGRIIEKLSGKSYEQYVRETVLTPAGITNMTTGGNTLADRKPNEVIYNGQGGQNPYLYNISRMDSHGGWIASATDLARFLVKVNGVNGKPDILQPATITTMTTRSVPASNYACGWGVNNAGHWWHTGSLPGTASEIIRTNGGFGMVILCNTRSTAPTFVDAMDGLLWPAVNNASTPWQDIDQF